MRMGVNQEKFKNTFDKLHASPDVIEEVLRMSEEKKTAPMRRKYITSRAATAAAAVCLLAGSGTAAYALNVGGIQRIVQIWTHGNQTNATFTVEDGSYTLEYTDESGNKISQEGGGIAYNKDGTQRSLTAEELMEQLSMPEVVYEEDGSVWIYYYNQKMEITDKFEDGVCYVELKANGKTLYVTVEYEKGYTMSEVKFQKPTGSN